MLKEFLKISRSYLCTLAKNENYTGIRRSMLYVPAIDQNKLSKHHNFKHADSIIIDLEDSVAYNQKDTARMNALEFFKNVSSINHNDIGIRINSTNTPFCEADINEIFSQTSPSFLMIPKIETTEQLKWINNKIKDVCKDRIQICLLVESAMAILNLKQNIEFCINECSMLNIKSLVFGADDFIASIGIAQTHNYDCVKFARSNLILHAKAFGLDAIDRVVTNYRDHLILQNESEISYKLGFTGRQVIHPSQCNIVNKCYSPTEEMINWAKDILELYERNLNDGKGVFVYKGKMVDEPVIKQAKIIMKICKKI